MTAVDPLFITALSSGLLGGFGHCLGMCGPIVSGLTLGTAPAGARAGFASLLFYNLGRVMTYSALGALMGLAGSFVNVAGRLAHIQNIALYLSGLLMVVMGLEIVGVPGFRVPLEKHGRWVTRLAGRLRRPVAPTAFLPVGALLGLLPCGLSYTFMIAAAGTADAAKGAVIMLLFGLGTVPAMTSTGALALLFRGRARGWLYRAGGGLVLLSGLYVIARGLLHHAHL